MSDPISRLNSLQVTDVMTSNVVELYASESMTQAAEAFTKYGVSSAPVIDEQDRCVGMLSAADFLQRECRENHTDERSNTGDTHRLVQPPGGGPMHIAGVPENKVSCYMTSAVQSIAPDVPLLKAALIMNAEHVHRLPVLDADGRVVGLISTMDIVASLINAIDESATQFLNHIQNGES